MFSYLFQGLRDFEVLEYRRHKTPQEMTSWNNELFQRERNLVEFVYHGFRGIVNVHLCGLI